MEFIGMLFIVLFCYIFEVYAIAAVFGVLLIISLMTLIPEEKRSAVKLAGCVLLGLTSVILLISM